MRTSIRSAADMQLALRQGFPYASFDAVATALGTPAAELAGLLGIAPRTLARRKARRALSPHESDRLYRVAQVTLRAADTLGSLDRARAWLHQPNQALGGLAPLGQLDTEIGERQVEALLDRINYGMYS